MLARKLLELGVSAIIDLSEMALPSQRQYVAALVTAISEAPRALWHDALVIIDEAHLFAPQKFKKGERFAAESLAAIALAASIWRKRGYCLALATQRIAKLDNDVAAELLNKLIGRTSNEDRKRAGDELGITADESRELRNFQKGTFYAYGPAISDTPVLVQTAYPLHTKPPKRGAAREAAPPTPAAIRAIADALAELPKEAAEEAASVEALQRKVVQLQRDLKAHEKGAAQRTVHVEKPVADPKAIARAVKEVAGKYRKALEAALKIIVQISAANFDVAGVDKAELERALSAAVDRATGIIDKRLDTRARELERLKAEALRIAKTVRDLLGEEIVVPVAVTKNEPFSVAQAPRERTAARRAPAPGTGPSSLPRGERTVLIAIAQHGDEGVTREQLTQLTGYKRSTRDAYIQRMSQAGNLEVRGDRIVATDDGIAALGDDYEPLPTGRSLYEHWIERLPAGEARILKSLEEAYPEAVSRDQISTVTGFARSSRDAYIQRLKARRLVEDRNGGVRMSDTLHG